MDVLLHLSSCLSANPRAQYLLARAAGMAHRMDAELYALHVDIERNRIKNEKSLEANLQFAESLGAKPVRLKGTSVADAAAQFVREKHVTQMIFGRFAGEGWRKLRYLNAINRFLRDAPAVDVHIVTQAIVQIHMPRMSKDELLEIVDKGLAREEIEMEIDTEARNRIAALSLGLPFHAHALTLYALRAAVG